MAGTDPNSKYIERLRQWRTRPDKDVSLGFLREQFKREVEKPYKQLHAIAEVWAELVPATLSEHVRLESLARGVLRVAVDSSSVLYELDRMLRGGLEQELIRQHKGPAFRSVKLRVAAFDNGTNQSPRTKGRKKT